ncbi:F0F1 ATP synthase subunit B [Prolixibacteraceae bacterium JC049]|nr:F0F1 ATP synthase subunit B [Prolixibacteraceae bacterium JC049]
MELLNPGIGLLFWMSLSFGIVFFILKKFAWKPILNALKEREQSIDNALKSADKAKAKMAEMQAGNQRIMKEAQKEKDQLLKEAKEIKKKIISDAKEEASLEAVKMIEEAKRAIENEKATALNEIKKQVADLSITIAEKVLEKELSDPKNQEEMVDDMLSKLKLN